MKGLGSWRIVGSRKIHVLGVVVIVFWIGCFFWAVRRDRMMFTEAPCSEVAQRTWRGARELFIGSDGCVRPPRSSEFVFSEFQAQAMLRAVWMGDKETFDRCYRWAEGALSRRSSMGDDLLASVWGFGRVLSRTSRSRADMDYALALLFAEAAWSGQSPSALTPYGDKARAVLRGILDHDTFQTSSGRLYLLKENQDL
jgi:endo-1,4-beta-D-glucanase Y